MYNDINDILITALKHIHEPTIKTDKELFIECYRLYENGVKLITGRAKVNGVSKHFYIRIIKDHVLIFVDGREYDARISKRLMEKYKTTPTLPLKTHIN